MRNDEDLLSNGTVSDYDTLDCLHGWLGGLWLCPLGALEGKRKG